MLNTKWTFLSGLLLFQLGSLICGVAPTSKVLIVGRAIAGTGSAGILTGAFVVVTRSAPLQKRPLYAGIVGMMYVSLHQIRDCRNKLMDGLFFALGSELELLLAPFWEVPSRTVQPGAGVSTLTYL